MLFVPQSLTQCRYLGGGQGTGGAVTWGMGEEVGEEEVEEDEEGEEEVERLKGVGAEVWVGGAVKCVETLGSAE